MKDTLDMSVSQIFHKDGKKYAFVFFSDNIRSAEGKIPDCKIIANQGFSEEEVLQLEEYMGRELISIKRMAAGVRVMDAFMKR